MREIAAAVLLSLASFAPAAGEYRSIDPQKERLRAELADCMVGSARIETCLDSLRLTAIDEEASSASREFALDALAQLDLRLVEIDETAVLQDVAGDTTGPSRVTELAEVLLYRVQLLQREGISPGSELFEGLLAKSEGVDAADPLTVRWAATEMCARGSFNPVIAAAIERGYGPLAREILDDCRLQGELRPRMKGDSSSELIGAALKVRDWSWTQAFHRLAIELASGEIADETKRALVADISKLLGSGQPGEVIVAGTALRQLKGKGWTDEEMAQMGLRIAPRTEP